MIYNWLFKFLIYRQSSSSNQPTSCLKPSAVIYTHCNTLQVNYTACSQSHDTANCWAAADVLVQPNHLNKLWWSNSSLITGFLSEKKICLFYFFFFIVFLQIFTLKAHQVKDGLCSGTAFNSKHLFRSWAWQG